MRTVDRLEYQARQWGMFSSLSLVTATVLLMTVQLNSLPELASRSMADKMVSLAFRALPPVSEPVEKQVPEVVEPVVHPPAPRPQPVVARPPDPEPEPVQETISPEPKPMLKPAVRKKKIARPVRKPPTREVIRKEKVPLTQKQPVPAHREKQVNVPVVAAKPAPEPAVYEQAMLDTIPTALDKSKPAYPRRARRMNITGSVKIRFLVTREGRVAELQIIKAKPQGIFEKTVRKTVQKWRFTPGVKNGRKVATWMTTTINFELE
jgi:protein TonB